MAGRTLVYGQGGAGGTSNLSSFLLQNQRVGCSSSSQPHHDSLFISSSSPSFLGSRSMVSFEDVNGRKRSNNSFYHSYDQEERVDEELEEYFRQPEKKRRLTADQVLFLEKSFEDENKLEPERKAELAKELGLQPRQIAVWFQNRRARWKTKQLEKDYETLQASYDKLKADYDNLLKEKEQLKAEVVHITEKLLIKEKENENSKLSHSSSLSAAPAKGSTADSACEDEVSKVSAVALKQEDLSSAKSDVLDSDSPHYTDGVHSSLLEPGDSSYALEQDQSDLSQDEEDDITKTLMHPAYLFLKMEDSDYHDPQSSCYYGFPVEDQAFGFWSY
ncbi:unnamed protein product [Coffea canephora]|uniref:Homeobox-leucine zipper protein n=2 Tax=Coffea TaxID=13442 RepID=A0A068V4R4_COFCA|nr:unnamed protein product [Coffea canephora]